MRAHWFGENVVTYGITHVTTYSSRAQKFGKFSYGKFLLSISPKRSKNLNFHSGTQQHFNEIMKLHLNHCKLKFPYGNKS